MRLRTLLTALLALLLAACGADEPIRIAFIGGLSERTNDTGESGRNALILAIEQRNAAGGINSRPLELVVGDDGQDPDTARKAMSELLAAKPEVVVGPYTSSMAAAVLPLADSAGVVLLSPVITALDFAGKDDMLIRLNRTTRDNARDYARVLLARGQKRLAVAYDVRNRAFTESWLAELAAVYEGQGGELVARVEFTSAANTPFGEVAERLQAPSPDGILFIAAAVDVARLAQQVRKLSADTPLSAVEWASTEQLLELGGRAVEGMLLAQSHNREDTSPRFVAFRDAFRARFQREPGYSAIATYDAAIVLFDALAKRGRGQPLKQAILDNAPYPGLQHEIRFDRFGDSYRDIFFAEIRDGRFELVR